jgi:mutator protein MutT
MTYIMTRKLLEHKQIGVAVIANSQNQFLIDRRPAQGPLGGLWEFPGGKIEAGETVVDCITREVWEEIGLVVEVGPKLVEVEYTYPHCLVILQVYLCNYVSGVPQAIACEEIRWVTLEEIEQFAFPEANQKIITALREKFH